MSVKQFGLAMASILLPILAAPVVAADAADDVLAQWGDITVTQDDMRRYLDFYLPDEDQAKALQGNFNQYVGNMIMMRELAQRAREQKIGPDSAQMAWQKEYQSVVWLVKDYQARAVEQAKVEVDLEAQAQELYIAEPERFMSPDKVAAAHILVQVKGRTDEEAQELIESVRKRAVAGESFAQLAKDYSEDKGSRVKGGSLGEFEAGQMVPEFSEAAFALAKPGDISEVIKTQFGYHIIVLNKKVPGTKRPFKKLKPKLIEELKQGLAKATIDTMLGDLRQEVFSQQLNVAAANKLRAEYGLEPLLESTPAVDD